MTPAELLGLTPFETSWETATLLWLTPRSRGEGLLAADVGAAHASIPISVTGHCLAEASLPRAP